MLGQNVYTLFRPTRRRIKRNKVVVGGFGHQFDSDLLDLSSLSSSNDNYKYLLTAVDILSKFAYCQLLRSKRAEEVVSAYRKILNSALEQNRLPFAVRTDKGGEFLNAKFNKLMREYGVTHFTSQNTETKANYAEIFQRGLKRLVYKYLAANRTQKYHHVLNDLVHNYNHSYHRTIKAVPAKLKKGGLEEQIIWRRQYESEPPVSDSSYKFKVGDYVRVNFVAKPFDRAFHETFSREVFQVSFEEEER